MNRKPSFAHERLYAAVVATASRAPNRDNRVSTLRRHRNVETAATVIEARNPSAALDISRHQTSRCADNAAAAHGQNANARLAHRDPGNASRRKRSQVGDAQALAGAPQRDRGIAVSPGRQNSIAGIDDDKCFGSAANNLHRINGGNTVGAGRQRLPHLDA